MCQSPGVAFLVGFLVLHLSDTQIAGFLIDGRVVHLEKDVL
jgi:hypothetical protein